MATKKKAKKQSIGEETPKQHAQHAPVNAQEEVLLKKEEKEELAHLRTQHKRHDVDEELSAEDEQLHREADEYEAERDDDK
jgi:hypothetical protein